MAAPYSNPLPLQQQLLPTGLVRNKGIYSIRSILGLYQDYIPLFTKPYTVYYIPLYPKPYIIFPYALLRTNLLDNGTDVAAKCQHTPPRRLLLQQQPQPHLPTFPLEELKNNNTLNYCNNRNSCYYNKILVTAVLLKLVLYHK